MCLEQHLMVIRGLQQVQEIKQQVKHEAHFNTVQMVAAIGPWRILEDSQMP